MAERVHLFTTPNSLQATPNSLHATPNLFHATLNSLHNQSMKGLGLGSILSHYSLFERNGQVELLDKNPLLMTDDYEAWPNAYKKCKALTITMLVKAN